MNDQIKDAMTIEVYQVDPFVLPGCNGQAAVFYKDGQAAMIPAACIQKKGHFVLIRTGEHDIHQPVSVYIRKIHFYIHPFEMFQFI